MTSASLSERVGGPVGRHSDRRSQWFDPGAFAGVAATMTWLVLMLRHRPCQSKPGDEVNAFLRLCYSDIPIFFRRDDVFAGKLPYLDFQYGEPVLSGVFATLARGLSRVLGARVGPNIDSQSQLDGAFIFLLASGILLFVCFLALVTAHMLLGRGSQSRVDGARWRSWDAMFVAGAPVVLASGLINWDMFAVALVAWGIWAWAVRRPILSGVFFGLAAAAKLQLMSLYPLPIVLGIGALCLRAGKRREFFQLGGSTLATWGGLTLVTAIINPDAVHTYLNPSSNFGSLWYIVEQMGLKFEARNAVSAVLILVCWAAVIWLALTASRRPRVGQIAYLMMLPSLILGTQFAPQYSLWLLSLMVFARPTRREWIVFNFGEVIYWLAIWMHLNGTIAVNSGSVAIYWIAIVIRIGCELFVAWRVVDDIRRPWDDPVREPFIDDPLGGVLDHAADVALRGVPAHAPEAATPGRRAVTDDEDADIDDDLADIDAVSVSSDVEESDDSN